MASRIVLQCGDCGVLLNSPGEAQHHAKNTCHTNFLETDEPMRYLVCNVCGKTCSCRTESGFHAQRTGHTEFQDRTAEVVEQERRAREENLRQTVFHQFVQSSLPLATKAEQMKECLWTIKQNHMNDEAKVEAAFTVLLRFAENVWRNPDEEKYRKIRMSNAAVQEKIGKLPGGIEFLELCGFEKSEGGEFLYMPREKVDMDVLYLAGIELNNALKKKGSPVH